MLGVNELKLPIWFAMRLQNRGSSICQLRFTQDKSGQKHFHVIIGK